MHSEPLKEVRKRSDRTKQISFLSFFLSFFVKRKGDDFNLDQLEFEMSGSIHRVSIVKYFLSYNYQVLSRKERNV